MKALRETVFSGALLAHFARAFRGKLARDFVFTAGSNYSIALFGAVGGILAARLLGPEGRGELAVAIVWAGILSGAVQLGLPQALTYVTAREPGAIGSVFSTTMVLLLVQSVGILLVGWFAVGILAHFQPTVVDGVRIYLLSIPFSLSTTYLSTMAQGLKRFQLFNGVRLASAAGYPIALSLAYFLDLNGAKDVIVLLLGTRVIIALITLFWFFAGVRPVGNLQLRRMRQLLGYGLRSYWGNLSWMANVRLDQFIMSGFVGLDEMGYYAVAVSYSAVSFPLSGAFAMVLFPNVVKDEQHKARKRIERTLKLNLIISGGGALVLALLSPAVLPWLFGADFRPSIYPAVILLGGTVVLGCNYVLSDGLRGLGEPMVVSVAEIVGVAVTISGLMILLPQLGIIGAALVSLLSYSTVSLVLLVCYKRRGRMIS